MILCVDSSGRFLSFALASEKGLIHSVSFDVNGKMNENIITLMDTFLRGNNTDISEISRLAVITGPGSFTGIRIGMAALAGMAAALGIDFKGLSTLDAIAVASKRKKVTVAAKLKLDEYAARDYDFTENSFSGVYITNIKSLDHDCVIADEYVAAHIISEAAADANAQRFLTEPAPLYVKKSEAEINFDKKGVH